MNKYQQQVAQMDAKHHVRVRVLSFAGAAALMFVVLWAADFRIGSFDLAHVWDGVKQLWVEESSAENEKKDQHAISPPMSTPAVSANQSTDTSMRIPGTDSSLSPVPLELLLVGTKPGRNINEGLAFIGTDRLHPQTYVAGAIMENGARLVEIYSDRVVLEKSGHRAVLQVQSGISGTRKPKSKDSLLFVGGMTQQVASHPKTVEAMTDYIRYVPKYKDDRLVGFTVYSGNKSSPFNRWGLQSGDVIESIDGAPLTSSDEVEQLLRPVMNGAAVMASVRRQERILQVALDGADLVQKNVEQNGVVIAPPTPSP